MTRAAEAREFERLRDDGHPSDLAGAQFALVAPLIPAPKVGPWRKDVRSAANSIPYLSYKGCQSPLLSKAFSPWLTVYDSSPFQP